MPRTTSILPLLLFSLLALIPCLQRTAASRFGGRNSSTASLMSSFPNVQWTWIGGTSSPNQIGVYGTKGVADSSNIPGSRSNVCGAYNSANNTFMIFGGMGFDSVGNQSLIISLLDSKIHVFYFIFLFFCFYLFFLFCSPKLTHHGTDFLNDLWQYKNGLWTWLSGSNTVNGAAVFGTRGVAGSSNVPGGRLAFTLEYDSSNNSLLLFGGFNISTQQSRIAHFPQILNLSLSPLSPLSLSSCQ